jgi:hypothetical protein
VDRHFVDAGLDQDMTFSFDAGPEPDPDPDLDPYPTPSFAHVGKSEEIYFYFIHNSASLRTVS